MDQRLIASSTVSDSRLCYTVVESLYAVNQVMESRGVCQCRPHALVTSASEAGAGEVAERAEERMEVAWEENECRGAACANYQVASCVHV
jgi:hypothetical protein